MGKGEKGRHGGFGGRSHGIGHSSFGHSRSHGISHSSFGHGRSHGIGHSSFGQSRSHGIGHSSFRHHYHGMGHSSFGHRSYRGGGGGGIKTLITDPNWDNKEPSTDGNWKGELCDFCYSPGDCICACCFSNCYSLMLANDIGMH
jgi:hypothetical protein